MKLGRPVSASWPKPGQCEACRVTGESASTYTIQEIRGSRFSNGGPGSDQAAAVARGLFFPGMVLAAWPKKLGRIVRLALITGARIGELLALEWQDISETQLLLLETKNGRSRRLPEARPSMPSSRPACAAARPGSPRIPERINPTPSTAWRTSSGVR
jgi:hypothetical protein